MPSESLHHHHHHHQMINSAAAPPNHHHLHQIHQSPAAGAAPLAALQCPRCESPNTKFCYYNNYNLSQPRHFCKSCRRYWTHGGALRDVPVGGGSRKSAKRSRPSSSSAAAATSSSSSSSSSSFAPKLEPVLASDPNPSPSNPSECVTSSGSGFGLGFGFGFGFTSLLSSQAPGLLGLEEIPGAVWPFHEAGEFLNGGGGNTWQNTSGSEGLVESEFVWPELSISMPGGNGLK